MREFTERIGTGEIEPSGEVDTLTIPFDIRQKCRVKIKLDSGEEVALILQRGKILRGGDFIGTCSGDIVQIKAEPEKVSTVEVGSSVALARICYHLGNRHVPLEICSDESETYWARYQHDHVLNEMVQALGGNVTVHDAPFEPEKGAYSNQSHGH